MEAQTINGTIINQNSNAVGLVYDKETGQGIPGIKVTDGYIFTLTDQNGVYQLRAHPLTRNIYISIPAEYKVPLNPETHLPLFYSTTKFDHSQVNRNDFALEQLPFPENDWTLIAIGDPQCKTVEMHDRFVSETIPDIIRRVNSKQTDGQYPNAYALTLGDVIQDDPSHFPMMVSSMSNIQVEQGYLPFFQCIGNHDQDAHYRHRHESINSFLEHFGPVDYSFDRGQVHVIVMDNVIVKSNYGTSWGYTSGFSDLQWRWLQQDLDLVQHKESKMVIFVCHIPFPHHLKPPHHKPHHFEAQHIKPHHHQPQQMNAQDFNAQDFNAQQMNEQQLNAQQLNAQQLNAQQLNAQDFKAQQMNVQQMDAQQMNAQQMDAQKIDARQMNPQQMNPQKIDVQQMNPQQMEAQYLEEQYMEAQQMKDVKEYYAAILDLLTQFHEAHLMTGHTHYTENYIHDGFLCGSGQPPYEHVHTAAGGGWWTSNISSAGSPNGYTVYEITGNQMHNWVAKGTNMDDNDAQIRVYNGNQTYGQMIGDLDYTFSWTAGGYMNQNSNAMKASTRLHGRHELRDCLVAAIWGDDDHYWRVDLEWHGKKYKMKRIKDRIADMCVSAFFRTVLNKNTLRWAKQLRTYWYVRVPGLDPGTARGWTIHAIQTIPGSRVENHYTCTDKLQIDFTGFAK